MTMTLDAEVSVYVTVGGDCFHESGDCAGNVMNRNYVAMREAAKGWRPCGNCVGDAVRVAYWNVMDESD